MASSKRERELARQRAERQAARRAAERAKKRQRNVVLASVLAVLLVIGGGVLLAVTLSGDDEPADLASPPTATSEPTASDSAEPTPTTSGTANAAFASCDYKEAGEPAKEVDQPDGKAPKKDRTATIRTSQGAITVQLYGAKAPCTVNSFVHLATEDYYAKTPCHRLTTDGIFVLQCGDPTGSGSGGPGYQYADENLTGAKYPAGTLAMANAGPGTNGSQFFLVYKDTQLPPSYTPFGKITAGLGVVEAIAKAGTANGSPDGKPKKETNIEDIAVS